MHVTGTHIAYYHLCHRKLWLFANGLNMEHTSDLVAEGKLIGETTYVHRADKWQELEIDGIKLDHYDAKNGIVREVKKSSKRDTAHIAQLKYYLWTLEKNGIEVSHGILEYPKLRQTEEIWLSDIDRENIPIWVSESKAIINKEACPERLDSSLCKRCSYFDFCYSEESPEV